MDSLKDKVLLITGASRGIGRGLAETVARHGGKLAIASRQKEKLAEAVAALKDLGAEVVAAVGDVGHDPDARRIAQEALAGFGHVDVLVNNAAILAKPRKLVDSTPEEWTEVLRVNVVGTVNMIRHVLPAMEKRGSGIVVNLSSGWGRAASGSVASYCASKFAVEALTQSLGAEVSAPPIVFALNPGVIATDMLATAFGDVSNYPRPKDLAPNWLELFARCDHTWHGETFDLLNFG